MKYDYFDITTQIELEKQYSKLRSQVEADRLRVQQQMQTAYLLNAFGNAYKEPEPFITIYKSKPIRGIVLELQTLNPEFVERRKYEQSR